MYECSLSSILIRTDRPVNPLPRTWLEWRRKPPMSELKAFEGLHQALAHLCLRDGRARKDIAEAAGINASMLSGYCSGRIVPSLEHLDRLLTSLGVALEDLAAELQMVNRRRAAPT